jgi:pimeloyl-ACP methyl ester carboxylesterase
MAIVAIATIAILVLRTGAPKRNIAMGVASSPSSSLPPPTPDAAPEAPQPFDEWLAVKTDELSSSVRIVMPRGTEAHAPPIIMLGGVCAHAGWVCRTAFENAGDGHAFLCPQPSGLCSDGTPTWTSVGVAALDLIDASVTAARTAHPEALRIEHAILAGFSMGAAIVANYAMSRPGYHRLLLSSSDVRLDAARLRKHGIERVLLTANPPDGTRSAMERSAQQLQSEGLAARFMATAGDDHGFEPSPQWWAEALAWLEAD